MKFKLPYTIISTSLIASLLLIGCGGDNRQTTVQTLSGSIIKGPIDNATIMLKDASGKTLATSTSKDGKFELKAIELNSDFYTLESQNGSYEDEATKKMVTLTSTMGLKTLLTKAELQDMLDSKKPIALTPETTIFTTLVKKYVLEDTNLTSAMSKAQTLISNTMIKNSSPMPGLSGDKFLREGDFTTALPKDQTEAFARNRAVSFSYMVRDLGLEPDMAFMLMDEISNDLEDGVADGIMVDNREINTSQEFSLSRTKLFQDTTTRMQNGQMSQSEKDEFRKMGFDVDRFDGSMMNQENNLSAEVKLYLNSTTLPSLNILPTIEDEDGNPNDNKATYTFTANKDVNVTIQTPNGSWITPMWRYNNSPLPLVVRTTRGNQMTLNLNNQLDDDSTIHWHGFKVPADMDGGPDLPVAPNTDKAYTFTMDQPAASLWFHPHPDMQTGKQVYMGLAGVYLLEDNITKTLEAQNRLPSGDKDVVLLVQDRRFADETNGVRELLYKNRPMDSNGMLGDDILVNGSIVPKHQVSNTQYRYRLYNVSNARNYDFALSDGSKFTVIGTDGGLLDKPVEVDHILLGPAQRVEIIIDFSKYQIGNKVMFVSKPFNGDMIGMMSNSSNMGTNSMMSRMMHGNQDMGSMMNENPNNQNMNDSMGNNQGMGNMNGNQNMSNQTMTNNGASFSILRFDITTDEVDPITLYTELPIDAQIKTRYTLADTTNSKERQFVMSMGNMMGQSGNMPQMNFVINGKTFDPKRVDEFIEAGAIEVWSIKNLSPMAHPFHAHAIQYQILDRDGVPASGVDLGWKDTFLVQPGETVRVIGKFEEINKGDYMYHCHILEHEDAGMMGYFRVGDSGVLGEQ